MKKVGIVTIYDVPNYGSILQSYATIRIFEKLGYETNIINYTRKNKWVKSHISNKKKNNIIKKIIHALGLTSYGRMNIKLNIFRKKFLNLTKKYNSLADLQNTDWSEYSMMITGSDQVWNPRFIFGDSVYMLSFIPNVIKKISFSSSFAIDSIPDTYIEKYKKYLKRFTAISVREENGKNIIINQLGIECNIRILLDPTLLLSREEWLKSIPRSKFKKKEKYILYYMWDYAFNPKPYIYEVTKYFQDRFGYKIYALVGYQKISTPFELKMVNKCDASISEFIDLFYNADLVITSSFHGTAFAINFGIPLVSIIPNNHGDDRQSSLLNKLGVPNLAIKIDTCIETINPFYDIDEEQKKLNNLRQADYAWIQSNINY